MGLFTDEQLAAMAAKSAVNPNPMVRSFGLGPEGRRCKECAHLFGERFARVYWKCDLRKNTGRRGNRPPAKLGRLWQVCRAVVS